MEKDPFAIIENALNSPVNPDKEREEEFVQTDTQNTVKRPTGEEIGEMRPPGSTLATENLQESFKRAESVYKTYQENIKKSQMLKSRILIGAQKGEDPVDLLLLAARCIGCLTGDDLVYSRNMETYLEKYR